MDQKQIAYLNKLEERFLVLLKEVSPLFAADKLSWFREYIEHGEYGLALDALCHPRFKTTAFPPVM
jgi:hypothetical protein